MEHLSLLGRLPALFLDDDGIMSKLKGIINTIDQPISLFKSPIQREVKMTYPEQLRKVPGEDFIHLVAPLDLVMRQQN